MNVETFLIRIQEYYSEYKPIVLHAVKQFLEIYRQETILELYALCLLKYPNVGPNAVSYKPPPDVAMLNLLIDEAILKANKRRDLDQQFAMRNMKRLEEPEIKNEEAEDYFRQIKERLRSKIEKTEEAIKIINPTLENDTEREKRVEERRDLIDRQARELEGK